MLASSPRLIAAAALALTLGAAGAAHAQIGSITDWIPGGGLTCTPANAGCMTDRDCVAPPGQCLSGYCFDPDALICEIGSMGTLDCEEPENYRQTVSGGLLCVPGYFEVCSGGLAVRDCFVRVGSTDIVRYGLGDCDGDLIPNEEEEGGQICLPNTSFGIVTPRGECVRPRPCDSSGGPTTECAPDQECKSIGNGDAICTWQQEPAFCCDGASLDCPEDAECGAPMGGRHAYCDPPLCFNDLPFAEAVACYMRDGEFVDQAEGNCDGDMLANGDEADQGRDPCVPDDPFGEDDAGANDVDAAGTDAGQVTQRPRFGGGGGCACRAAAAPASGGGALFALAMVALWRRRRR